MNTEHSDVQESKDINLIFDKSLIDEYFPFDKFRDGQRDCIEFILDALENGKKYIILEAPTGSGKSAIAICVSRFFNSVYYLTIQKILQSQIINDFGDNDMIVDLKGRSTYNCNFYDRYDVKSIPASDLSKIRKYGIDCNNGFCRKNHKQYKIPQCFPSWANDGFGELSELPEGMEHSACVYYERVYRAINSHTCLMNFSSFLYQTHMSKRFGPRDLMVVDECLHPRTRIHTEVGFIPIGKLVNDKMPVRVASFNFRTRQIEYKPIVRWLRRDKQLTFKVLVGNCTLYPTADHKIFTPFGKKKVSELKVGDQVCVRQTEITSDQQQLVLGSLLGDASLQIVESKRISKKHTNKGMRSRIRFRHGLKQFQYLLWKYQILKPHAKTPPELKSSAGFVKITASFSTSCGFYDIIEPTLVGGRKSPNMQWLDKINAFGLAVWYMDSGSLISGFVRFNSHCFDLNENQIIVDWLKTVWNIDAKIKDTYKLGKLFHYISLDRRSTHLLMRIIAKYIMPQMRYKLQNCVPHDQITGENLQCAHRTLDITSKIEWESYDHRIETQICHEMSVHKIVLIEPYKETFNYDLEVADNHNYFAGNALVSNCHQTEPQLLNFIGVTLDDKKLRRYDIELEKYHTPEEYWIFFNEVDIIKKILTLINDAKGAGDISTQDEYSSIAKKLQTFMRCMENGDEWVAEFDGGKNFNTVQLKPVFANSKSHEYILGYGKRCLMMSATILDVDVFCRSIGITRSETAAFRMKNRFPVSNRLIYTRSAGSLSGGKKKMNEWGPRLLNKVDECISEHPDDRGIIHTHNFAIANLLIDKSKYGDRFLFQDDFSSKEKMLKIHANTPGAIIVAPAMHEGLNLIGDLSRFQIICKIPWANFFDDKQLARRVELDTRYYVWLTALKLCQSLGRSVRSEDDYAKTYVVDGGFESFLQRAGNMIPSWIRDAVV